MIRHHSRIVTSKFLVIASTVAVAVASLVLIFGEQMLAHFMVPADWSTGSQQCFAQGRNSSDGSDGSRLAIAIISRESKHPLTRHSWGQELIVLRFDGVCLNDGELAIPFDQAPDYIERRMELAGVNIIVVESRPDTDFGSLAKITDSLRKVRRGGSAYLHFLNIDSI